MKAQFDTALAVLPAYLSAHVLLSAPAKDLLHACRDSLARQVDLDA